jgi:antagonist of KipI
VVSELVVRAAGLLTTVQDLGRWGYQDVGVPVGGAMDTESHRVANALAGNDASEATLEITLSGPSLEVFGPITVAVAGADIDVTVAGRVSPPPLVAQMSSGQAISFGRRHAGARAYLAVAGGFDTPLVLGSRAADLRAGFPGLAGRAIRAGDRLPVGTRRGAPIDLARAPLCRRPVRGGGAALRVLPGPHADLDGLLDRLCAGAFVISPHSDRMGYRLEGRSLATPPGGDLVSIPTVAGTVQVLPDGTPILLMADRQTTGGYAQAAVVIGADLPLAGQLAPGDRVRFEPCSRADAMRALLAAEQRLLAMEGTR